MSGGLSSVRTAALLKGQGKPPHATVTMMGMRTGRRLDNQVRDEERHEAIRNSSPYEVAVPGVWPCLVCRKVHEGMLPLNYPASADEK